MKYLCIPSFSFSLVSHYRELACLINIFRKSGVLLLMTFYCLYVFQFIKFYFYFLLSVILLFLLVSLYIRFSFSQVQAFGNINFDTNSDLVACSDVCYFHYNLGLFFPKISRVIYLCSMRYFKNYFKFLSVWRNF